MPSYATDETINDLIKTSENLVIVDFTASWCAPCNILAPILDDLDEEFGDDLSIYKIDVDNSPEYAKRLGIRGLPTLLFLKNNEEVERHVGVPTKTRLAAIVESHLD